MHLNLVKESSLHTWTFNYTVGMVIFPATSATFDATSAKVFF
jgi:hypothetical protein